MNGAVAAQKLLAAATTADEHPRDMVSRVRTASWLLLGIAAAAGACSTTPVAPLEADRAITTAEAHFAAQDYDRAIAALEPLAEDACPKRLRDRRDLALARAYLAQGEHWDAFKAVRSFPDDYPHSELRPAVGDLVWEIGKHLAASDGGFLFFWSDRTGGRIALEHLITRHPDNPHNGDALRILGDLAFDDEDYLLAQQRFRDLMLNQPDGEWFVYAQYRFAMSIVASLEGPQYDLDQMEHAVRELRAFLTTQPENPQILRSATDALTTLQQWRIERHLYIADFYRTVGNAPGELLHTERAAADEFAGTDRHAEAIERRQALRGAAPATSSGGN